MLLVIRQAGGEGGAWACGVQAGGQECQHLEGTAPDRSPLACPPRPGPLDGAKEPLSDLSGGREGLLSSAGWNPRTRL